MPSSNDKDVDIKKQNDEKFNREKEAAIVKEDILRKEAAMAASLKAARELSEIKEGSAEKALPVTLKSSGDGDWHKVVAAYKKLYPEHKGDSCTLSFATKEEAIKFFTDLATQEPPCKFLAEEIGADGKPLGNFVFSCGNKKLYQGSLADIEQQLKTDLDQNPNDLNIKQGLESIQRMMNPTSTVYKDAIRQVKGPADEQNESSNIPNPLRTKPQ